MDIKDQVDKLKSPIWEIRNRAIENISDKVKYELLDLNPLVDATDFCKIVIGWFEDRLDIDEQNVQSRSTLPELLKIFQLFQSILENTVNGKLTLDGLNAIEILESWKVCYESYQDVTTKNALKIVIELLKTKEDESQLVSTYGASLKSTLVESSTQPSPGQYLDEQKNMSLPPHLLKSTIETNRNYSPVVRTYVKRVHFNEEFEDDDETNTDKPAIIPSPFAWFPLSKLDRDKLSVIHSALTSYKPEIIRDACIELTSDTFEDFPAEIFIQRPEIVFALQDILLVNSNPALKSLAAQAISTLCQKLINRFRLCTEVKSSQKDAILLMTLPQNSTTANNKNDTYNESQDDDNSFADQINTTKLKRSQLEPYEFCLMILSNAAAGFQHFDHLRPANACVELFENVLKLVHVVFDSNANLKGQKDLAESVLEIQNELLKSMLMHQKNRPIFLMLLKISLKFLDVSDELDGGLVAFVQKGSYDPTLYLSHKWLHEKLASSTSEEINFKAVQEMMTSMKHSIKVIQNSSADSIKGEDLLRALPSLKYHENYKKFIPLVMQKARSIRGDPDEISKMSMLITQMLQFPHVQVCQETHFQLHGLVQDILGIGQALDIQGSKKLELSFMIYDKGNIVKELLKSSLENDELNVKKAAIEIVLYLLKSEKFLGKQLWKIVKNDIIQPNQALLECCVQAEDQVNLSRWILSNLMPDDLSHFEANLRLLLTSKNIAIRRDAQANLRTILSKQSNGGSQNKLPRFGTILQTDLSELCNTAFSQKKIHLNFRTVKNVNNSLEHVSVKDLLDIIKISPAYDILTKKSALQQLGLLFETENDAKDFKEFGGLNIFLDLMDKCLEEKSSTSDLLPFALQSLKTICLHDQKFVEFLKIDTTTTTTEEENCYKQMLYVLTRSLYIYQDSQDVLENIVTILVLTLFHDWITLDGSNRLSMPSFMMNKLNLPIEFCIYLNAAKFTIHEPPIESSSLLKIYWNLAWFGGIEILNKWQNPKGDTQFSSNLYLEPLELSTVKNSFSEAVLEDLINGNLKESKTHSEFQEALQLARSHAKLLPSSNLENISWTKVFSRFLRLKPTTRNDEKLFLAIIDFVNDHADENSVDEILIEGKDNLIHFLTRDRPDNTGMDLLLKGHEKIAKFLVKTHNFKNLDVIEDSIWNHSLNHWSIQVLSKANPSMDKFKLNEILRIIFGHKPHLYSGSAKVYYSLNILEQFIHRNPDAFEDLKWLQNILINRDASIRILGFQIIANVTSSGLKGALSLIGEDQNAIWNQLIDVVLDRSESCLARENCMLSLTNLLKWSENKDSYWLGPIVKISGITLTGEASMSSFLTLVHFEENVSRIFRAFSHKNGGVNDINNVHSIFNDESIRQTSAVTNTASLIQDEYDDEVIEEPSSASFVASVLKFLIQIIKMDTSPKEKFNSLPMLESRTFPAAMALSMETTQGEENYGELLETLCEFLSFCLANFDWAWPKLVFNDRCQSLSMLIASFYHLNLDPETLLKTLSLVLLKGQDEEHYVSRMIQKYKIALLEMALKDTGDYFGAAFYKFIFDHYEEFNIIIDDSDPQLVEALAKKYLEVSDKMALKSMLLISAIAQDVMLEQKLVLAQLCETLDNNNKKTCEKLRLLSNFVYKNPKGQRFVIEELSLHRKIVSLANKIIGQYIISGPDVKKSLSVVICEIITLITNLICNCQESKSVLASNVAMEQRGKSSSILQILVDIINNDNLGDTIIRSRIWIPNCFRIITASLTSVECRSWIIRTPRFLNGRCIKDLDQTNPDENFEVLWLDLLLSLTSFDDGQSWLAKNGDVIDTLVEKAKHSGSLPSLAILRNLSFHTGRAKLLLLPNYLSLLNQCLTESGTKLRLCLTSLWALSTNCHKAKVVLARQGIPQKLENLQNSELLSQEDQALLSTTISVVTL